MLSLNVLSAFFTDMLGNKAAPPQLAKQKCFTVPILFLALNK